MHRRERDVRQKNKSQFDFVFPAIGNEYRLNTSYKYAEALRDECFYSFEQAR